MSNNEITPKKIRSKVLLRWIFTSSVSSNYEKMQALAYCYAILPFLKFTYRNDPDGLQEAVKRHLQFFNTNPWVAPYVLGLNIAIEENEKNNAADAVSSIKSGLMGPLAGLGDSLCVVIPWTIFGAIAANMAIEGNPAGIFLWIAVSIAIKMLSFPLFKAGYFSGTKLVNTLESKMKSITKATSILGLMVVGGLMSTVIRATVGFSFVQGEIEMTGQSILDQVMPGLIPAAIVGLMYYLLGKKVKPTYLILLIIVMSIILHSLGVLV